MGYSENADLGVRSAESKKKNKYKKIIIKDKNKLEIEI